MKLEAALVIGACLGLLDASSGRAATSALSAGVNLSGLEFKSGTLPGRANHDYVAPTDKELAYYQSKGVMMIRLPVLWGRLQPNLLAANPSTTLDPAYFALIQKVLAEAAARKMQVIVDVHNYGGYATHKIGDGTVTQAQFAQFWQIFASALKSLPGLGGYDLMNEPSNMPSADVWPNAAQAAVTAIRKVDTSSYIFVEGNNWASAGSWASNNQNLTINDPKSRIIYEAHVYGDRNASGTHFNWAIEASHGVTVDTLAQRIGVFSNWCQVKSRRCMIGEIGVGKDNAKWNQQLANGFAAMRSGGLLGFTYWAGGPWWGSYAMNIEPVNGVDATQMSVVAKYGSN